MSQYLGAKGKEQEYLDLLQIAQFVELIRFNFTEVIDFITEKGKWRQNLKYYGNQFVMFESEF